MKLIDISKACVLALLSASLFPGCSEDELDTYSGVPAAIYIQEVNTFDLYGNPLSYKTESSEYSFADNPSDITYIYLPFTVRLAGEVVDYDRPYVVKVDPEKTDALEGTDFDLSENAFTIKAGESTDVVRIKVLRNDRLLKNTYHVVLKLEPNEHFSLAIDTYKNSSSWSVAGDIYDATTYAVSFSEKYTAPDAWDTYKDDYWGEFSLKKYATLNGLMGWTAYDWRYANMSYSKVRAGKFPYAASYFRNHLIEEAMKGTPVIDEDGQPMQLAEPYKIDYSLYL